MKNSISAWFKVFTVIVAAIAFLFLTALNDSSLAGPGKAKGKIKASKKADRAEKKALKSQQKADAAETREEIAEYREMTFEERKALRDELKRTDLTWEQRRAIIAQLKANRVQTHGDAKGMRQNFVSQKHDDAAERKALRQSQREERKSMKSGYLDHSAQEREGFRKNRKELRKELRKEKSNSGKKGPKQDDCDSCGAGCPMEE